MFTAKTIWLAVNAASGSNNADALGALDDAFTDAGWTIARRIDCAAEDAPSLADLRGANVDLLVIFTGDGTVKAIVTALYGWEGAILVLPGGTMNLLARRLHGEVEPADTIAAIAAGAARRTRPALVRTRHGDALSGVLAGPGTAWADVREALREVDVVGTLKGAADAIGESAGGPKVFCLDPSRGREEGYSAIQLTPGEEGLAIDGYYAETIADYAQHGIALLRRNFRDGPHDELGSYAAVRLGCAKGEAMGLLLDGEPCRGDTGREESFTLARCDVDLLTTVDA